MERLRRAATLLALAAVLSGAVGCAARSAYRQGKSEGKKGNWDLAVARFTKALQKDPGNIEYKIALENARIQASRAHYAEGRKHLAAQELEKAADELEIAAKYDPANQAAADDLRLVRERLRRREEERERMADFEAMRQRAEAARLPVPVLSPRSTAPIYLRFADQSLQKVFESLGKLAGVNVLFDQDYRDKRVDVNLAGVTFEEALDQLTLTNRLFYKVLDQNTIIIVPESPQKRRVYDELLVRTFYLQNADVNETVNLVRSMTGIQRVAGNPSLGAITVMANPDKMALAARVIELNDKARGEVMVDVEILEVNRTVLKRYGIELSNYEGSVTFSPTGAANELASGFTSVRAHLLSSLNLADFVVNIPSTLLARFLTTDSTVRILASPRLRAAEGKKTSLRIGTEVPIPVTTFTATQAGSTTFAPATSFQYRNVGVNLELTPKVSIGGDVTLEVGAEFSLLGDDRNVGTGNNPIIVPTFLTRNVNGILRLKDGETSLIGGLLQGRTSTALRGALGISSIPILKDVFTSTQKQKDESEILISITPHVVRAPKVTEEDLAALFVGTEETTRVPSARPPLFGEPVPAPSPSPGAGAAAGAGPSAPVSTSPSPMPTAPVSPPPEPPSPVPASPSVPAAVPRPVTAQLAPGEVRLMPGTAGTLALVLLNTTEVTSVEIVLSYDPTLVELVDVTPGRLLTFDGASVGVERGLEPGQARARFVRASPTAGSGEVAVVQIRGLRAGEGTLRLTAITLTTPRGSEPVAPPPPARVVVGP